MPSSNKPLKYFFFIALAAIIGIVFAVFLTKGVSAYASLVSNLGNNLSNKIIPNQAAVVEAIPPPALPERPEVSPEVGPLDPLEVRPLPQVVLPELPQEITLSFVGDIMLDRSVKTSVEKNFNGDYNALFENLGELAQTDILFGNLEGPVSSGGKKSGSVFSFRMSSDSLSAIALAGFDILNIANNHIGDWGEVAFADTLDALTSNGMKYTGGGWNKNEVETPAIIEKNGIRVGFLGFTDVGPSWMAAKESNPGVLLASQPDSFVDFDQIIQNASNQVDVLVVSFHWGEEYKKYNKRQEELAHRAIDAGAKIIVGAHPHVIQDVEEYGGGLIAYSLGNFIFDQKFSEETMQGMLLQATVTKDGLKTYSKKLIKLNDKFVPQTPVDYAPE